MLVICTFEPRVPGLTERIKKEFPNVNFQFYRNIREVSAEALAQSEIIVTYGSGITEEHIKSAEKLKWIMVASAGVEQLPVKEIVDRNILVTNARGIHKIPMAEYTIAMMLQVSRNLKQLIENEKNNNWNRKVQTSELYGKTIAILGVGAIGGEIARLSKAFGMNTLGINRSGQETQYVDEIYLFSDINSVLEKADYIVCVLPSTDETRHLLQAEHFRKMKKEAVFINIGRGDLVEESILIKALEEKEIAHAVLDVFEKEPLEDKHPFWSMENVTITPHLSGVTKKYDERALDIFMKNLEEYLHNGRNYINVIDLQRGY